MLGLKQNTVTITAHEPAWLALGAATCAKIVKACGEPVVDVQHVGSTAVPGLKSKPIIDIVVGSQNFVSLKKITPCLKSLGYLFRGNERSDEELLFVEAPEENIRTLHIHVVIFGKERWFEYLTFRDALIKHDSLRREYESLKNSLCLKYSDDRQKYTEGKNNFIAKAMATKFSDSQHTNLDMRHCVKQS